MVVYFYYARYKPPSLDLRIENLIQPGIDILVVFILIFLQCRNVYRYQQLFGKKRVKILVWLTAVPVVIVTPVLKVSVVLATLFNQLATNSGDQSFDPKKTILLNSTDKGLKTVKVANEYDSRVFEWMEKSVIKEWFRPRHLSCVFTAIESSSGRNVSSNSLVATPERINYIAIFIRHKL